MKFVVAIFFFALCTTTATTSALAFKTKEMWWQNGNPTFVVCLTGAPANALLKLNEAALKWKYRHFEFKLASGRCINEPSWIKNDGVNYIAFGALDSKGSDSDIAEAFTRNVPVTNKLIECDIQFSSKKKWYTKQDGVPGSDESDFLSVALHEFGHCLGLDHSDIANAVMNGALPAGQVRRTLHNDDLAGRDFLYGKP